VSVAVAAEVGDEGQAGSGCDLLLQPGVDGEVREVEPQAFALDPAVGHGLGESAEHLGGVTGHDDANGDKRDLALGSSR
jgi:hypothetical protein